MLEIVNQLKPLNMIASALLNMKKKLCYNLCFLKRVHDYELKYVIVKNNFLFLFLLTIRGFGLVGCSGTT